MALECVETTFCHLDSSPRELGGDEDEEEDCKMERMTLELELVCVEHGIVNGTTRKEETRARTFRNNTTIGILPIVVV